MDTAGGTSHISTALIFMAALRKYAKYWHPSMQKFTHLSLMTLPRHRRQVRERERGSRIPAEIPMRQLQLSPSTVFCVAKSPVNIWEGWQSPRPRAPYGHRYPADLLGFVLAYEVKY